MPVVKPINIQIREYHALLGLNGSNNPVVTVLHNTLNGNITWTRSATGTYNGALTNGFIQNQTIILTNLSNVGINGRVIGGFANTNNEVIINTKTPSPTASTNADTLGTAHVIIKVYDNN